ncbi:MAG: tetratricopeptide repeat protein [Bdellovibrionota bacterium]
MFALEIGISGQAGSQHARSRMLVRLTFIAVISVLVSFSIPMDVRAEANIVEGLKIRTFKTHSRFMFGIGADVSTKFNSKKEGFDLFLKGVTLYDLGAPVGDEKRWQAKLNESGDPRISSLEFFEGSNDPAGPGVRITGKWKFPEGADKPVNPRMELFEYRSKTGEYIVDFWVKQGPTVLQAETARLRAQKQAERNAAEEKRRRRTERKIAFEKAKADANDVGRFCREPYSESNEVFLEFFPFHEKVAFSRWFSTKSPDEDYHYLVPKSQSRAAQYTRLALNLYKQGDFALVLRTLDFFDAEVPGGEHRHEMRFLRANALLRLPTMQQAAEEILTHLVSDSKNSPIALYGGIHMAISQMARGDHLASLESFSSLVHNFPKHRLSWVFHLGMAESMFALKQTERAAKEYQWVIENAQDMRDKAEAALRSGDLYLDRFQYEQTLAAYYRGLKRFGTEAEKFPSIHVNRAEALYQLGQYEYAKEAFENFLKRYPGHPAGWRATLRLGEISARQGGKDLAETARDWFYETINRYPSSPGATLARLRLLPCGDHGGMDISGLEKFISDEAASFDGRQDVATTRYRDFMELSRIRALITLGHENKAVAAAIDELHRSKNDTVKHLLGSLVGGLFRKSLLKLLDEGKGYEALAFYMEKKGMISKEASPVNTDFLLRLSQTAADFGLASIASELVAEYTKILALKQGDSRSLAADDLDLELINSDESFSKAKALWVLDIEKNKQEIKQWLAKVKDESVHSYERELMLGLLEEKEGHNSAAFSHAIKARLLAPQSGDSGMDARVEAWQAKLHLKAGDLSGALELYRSLEKRLNIPNEKNWPQNMLGLPAVPSMDTVVIEQGRILEQLGRWGEAASTYAKAVENGLGGNRAMFGYANALAKMPDGDDAKADGVFEKLAGSKTDDFWRKLASEVLANRKAQESIHKISAGNSKRAKEGIK